MARLQSPHRLSLPYTVIHFICNTPPPLMCSFKTSSQNLFTHWLLRKTGDRLGQDRRKQSDTHLEYHQQALIPKVWPNVTICVKEVLVGTYLFNHVYVSRWTRQTLNIFKGTPYGPCCIHMKDQDVLGFRRKKSISILVMAAVPIFQKIIKQFLDVCVETGFKIVGMRAVVDSWWAAALVWRVH